CRWTNSRRRSGKKENEASWRHGEGNTARLEDLSSSDLKVLRRRPNALIVWLPSPMGEALSERRFFFGNTRCWGQRPPGFGSKSCPRRSEQLQTAQDYGSIGN